MANFDEINDLEELEDTVMRDQHEMTKLLTQVVRKMDEIGLGGFTQTVEGVKFSVYRESVNAEGKHDA